MIVRIHRTERSISIHSLLCLLYSNNKTWTNIILDWLLCVLNAGDQGCPQPHTIEPEVWRIFQIGAAFSGVLFFVMTIDRQEIAPWAALISKRNPRHRARVAPKPYEATSEVGHDDIQEMAHQGPSSTPLPSDSTSSESSRSAAVIRAPIVRHSHARAAAASSNDYHLSVYSAADSRSSTTASSSNPYLIPGSDEPEHEPEL